MGIIIPSKSKPVKNKVLHLIIAISRPPKTTKNSSRFNENDFVYNAEQNNYTCPQGNQLTARQNSIQNHGRTVTIYRLQSLDTQYN